MNKVLFVCTANVCRSPMAEAIFNAVARDMALPYRAESAGTAALKGKPMAPNAIAVLEEIGFDPEPHLARQVSQEMVEEADLVLAMGPSHAAALRRLEGEPSRKVHALPEYAIGVTGELSDPYGYTMFAYRNTARQLYEYVQAVLDRLRKRQA